MKEDGGSKKKLREKEQIKINKNREKETAMKKKIECCIVTDKNSRNT